MYELTKKFRFESAHRLAKNYKGKCANIHGHSWNGELVITAVNLDAYDFAIDFGELKKFTKAIENALDHKILLHQSDLSIIALCRKNNWDIHVFDHNPTSEIVAKWIYNEAVMFFEPIQHLLRIKHIVIEETCTSRCVYSKLRLKQHKK